MGVSNDQIWSLQADCRWTLILKTSNAIKGLLFLLVKEKNLLLISLHCNDRLKILTRSDQIWNLAHHAKSLRDKKLCHLFGHKVISEEAKGIVAEKGSLVGKEMIGECIEGQVVVQGSIMVDAVNVDA